MGKEAWAVLVVAFVVGVALGTMIEHPNEADHLAGDVIRGALGL